MDLSNVAQLSVPQIQSLERRNKIDAPEKEADFLSLRLLNKRGRVRLSPAGIDHNRLPGKSSLFAVGNAKGWFAVAICKADQSHNVLVAELSELHTMFESGQADPEPFIPFNSSHSPFSVPGTPTFLKFALHDERLIIGFLEGPILVYSTIDLFALGQGSQPNPIFTFPGDASSVPREILPNPGDNLELVAVLRGVHGQDPGHQVDVIDVKSLRHVAGWRKGNDSDSAPVSISWSPKGKQIAVGLQSGDMVFYSPMSPSNPKSHFPRPRSIPAEASSLLSTTWLSPPTFYTVFSTPEASSTLFNASTQESPMHTHFISTHDSKFKAVLDVQLRDPCPPFGAARPPGPFALVLRNWNPTKFIIFCGGGPSSDIGVIGALPSNDSSTAGNQWMSFNLEETSTPSLPLDEELNDLALLGLDLDFTSSKPIRMSEQPDDGTPDLPPSPILYAYMNDGTVVAWHILNNSGEPYPGMSAVGTPSTAADQSVSQQGGSVQASSPRVSPVAAPEPTSVFNPHSTSISPPPTSAFGQPQAPSFAPAKGFGAFASANSSSTFGSRLTGFGFGESSAPSAFGSSSFGGGSTNQGEQIKPAPSAFSTTGFGGPAQQTPGSSPAVGTTGFGQSSTAPTFGSSSFGSKPAVPAFGQSSFGATAAGTSKSAGAFGSTTGGFASYANQGSTSGGFASFATQGSSAFGAPVDSTFPSVFGRTLVQTTSSFGSSAFGTGSQQKTSPPASAFGSGGVGQAHIATSPPQQGAQSSPASGSFGKSGTTPAFGKPALGKPTTPPARESGGFGGLGTLGDALKRSTSPTRPGSPLDSPPSPANSLPDSPELRPRAQPEKPAPSYLKPAEGFGSFNRPSEGFGPFGGKTSSFIKPGEGFGATSLQKSPVPALAQVKESSSTRVPAASSGASGAPTFGSTSTLGHVKPVFGASSFGSAPKPAIVDPSKPITGGFGAFSSGGGGFASFAGAGRSSFADILSSGESGKTKPDASPLAFGDVSLKKASSAPASVSFESRVSSGPTAKSADLPPTPEPGTGIDDSFEERKEWEDKDKTTRSTEGKQASQETSFLSSTEGDPSFSLLSLGEAASKVASASSPKSDDSVKNKDDLENVDETGEGEERDDTASEPFSLTEDDLEQSASEEGERESRSPTASLPDDENFTRGTGSTSPRERTLQSPTQEPETITRGTKTLGDAVSPPFPESSHLPLVGEPSTTPPGSPEKPSVVPQTVPASVAPSPVSTPSPGLGLGRPSSRPIRSSPLASAPITNAEVGNSSPDVSLLESVSTTEPKPTESTPPSRQQSQPGSPVILSPVAFREGPSNRGTHRPKTPPLLSIPSVPDVVPQFSDALGTPTQREISPTGSSSSASLPTQQAVPGQYSSPPPVSEEEMPSHPMQVQFLYAYQQVTRDVVQLSGQAQSMAELFSGMKISRNLESYIMAETFTHRFSYGDLEAFIKLLTALQKRIVPLLQLGNTNKRSLRDLQNLALISETKREEVSRWVRACQDPDFASTLQTRTLGPEHSENQTRLRKAVQIARDRFQKCEDEIESLKKRLDQHKSGRIGFRAPSLDTIDRTCRNIQLALEERSKLLEQLQDRVNSLSPNDSRRLKTIENTRTPVSNTRLVTPPFASVAAAALNSERSSLKLKSALLSARKKPLLTNKVVKLESSSVVVVKSRRRLQSQQRSE